MISQLIERTNRKGFYSTGRLHLTELKGQIGIFKTMEFHFIVDEQSEYGDFIDIEHWRLIAHQTLEFSGIFAELYLPYIKFQVLEEHPLLWAYNKNELECQLLGYPENLSEFIGDLFTEYEKVTGNWIPLHEHFWNLDKLYKQDKKWNLSIAEPLKDSIQKVCKKHRIEFKITQVREVYNEYKNRSKAKLLIFGNEEVSPNGYSSRQPYIIAEEFIASKK